MNIKKILTHAGIVLLILAISAIYFKPILQGKALPQGDIQKYESMATAQKDYHARTGEYTTWCPSMFSGMPGYQITNSPQHSVFGFFRNTLSLGFMGRGNDMGILFLYLLGFYVAMAALGVNPWLALMGALAFGLGSYNIIIIEAGHITKAWAMAMMAPVLAGMLLCFKGAGTLGEERRKGISNLVWGGILFTLALGTQIAFNHIQITFYTAIAGVVMGLVYAVYSAKDRYLARFLLAVGVLLAGVLLALACNTRHLLVNQEYVEYTMRGGSEISVTPQDLYGKDFPKNNNTNADGLDINYAFGWSYGVGETYTILVPGARGGGSGEKVDHSSASYNNLHIDQAPLYWGNQPFTSGPVYFGAIVCFLFLFGMIVVRGPERWWMLIATLLTVVMAWGSNAIGFNGWLFEHLPMYNKFRTPSMSLVIPNLLMAMMGVFALKELFDHPESSKRHLAGLLAAAGATVLIILIGLGLSGGFSFSGSADQQMAAQYGNQWPMLQSIFVEDRRALFVSDSWRSILFVLLGAAALLPCILAHKGSKPKSASGAPAWLPLATTAAMALLIVVDLQGVNSRYLSEENYVRNANMLKDTPAQYDMQIDAMAAQAGDRDYRVLNLAVNTFNDSKPSAFHNQIGGYSAAKLRRYQDLIDFYLSYRIQPSVLNMLNTRYIVLQNGEVQRNPEACGNAWFVREAVTKENADSVILALSSFNPAATALFDKNDTEAATIANADTAATIEMEHTGDINCLRYRTRSATEQWAVFSEIYYAPDWKAYIDGQPAEYTRADYVLRAMRVPAGDHTIEFRNEAPTQHRLDNITLICSIVTMLIIAGVLVVYYRKRGNKESRS